MISEVEIVNKIHKAVKLDKRIFFNKYPLLSENKSDFDSWSFFMTAAGVGVYLITHKTSSGSKDIILMTLKKIDEKLPKTLNLFLDYFMEHKNAQAINYKMYFGYWVMLNMLGRKPTLAECARASLEIGQFLEKTVFSLDDENHRSVLNVIN